MYRVRFHGRGGQGVKTASRILGSAFFAQGFQVQDAPRYGAERRGAPIFAYVRADGGAIKERGAIVHPDLVVLVDESLLPLPVAGVLEGVSSRTVLLLNASRQKARAGDGIKGPGAVVTIPEVGQSSATGGMPLAATAAAGAAARLTGVISAESLRRAIEQELSAMDAEVRAQNLELALSAYHRMEDDAGRVQEGGLMDISDQGAVDWVILPLEDAFHAAPNIYGGATSELTNTGLWRTERPIIDHERCKRCWWVCGTFCPDGVITLDSAGALAIDYAHCKGCMICLVECPSQAIGAIPEWEAQAAERSES